MIGRKIANFSNIDSQGQIVKPWRASDLFQLSSTQSKSM